MGCAQVAECGFADGGFGVVCVEVVVGASDPVVVADGALVLFFLIVVFCLLFV